MCFSVCGEGRRQRRAVAMAACEHGLPGGDAAGEPGEGVRGGDLRLRGGAGSFRKQRHHGEKPPFNEELSGLRRFSLAL